ncbi:MAG: hypothetical protein JNL11_18615 [Bdellovibrionaceae bacterium]|nr:hypothetical protein [Pseudobdellovibrionaceae bacterium]
MSKVLLVYDDFAELNATELSLKKCNFDVIGLTNEYTVKDQIVAFNPDIIVGFGNSQRVSSISIGKKVKDMTRWTGKSILIFPRDYDLPAEELLRMRMDMLLESPISVIRLIQIICKLTKQDEKVVIEKLAKSFAKDRTDKLAFAAYDAETVKVIQNIQGELDKLNAEKPSTSAIGSDEGTFVTGGVGTEPTTELKKSFFGNEETTHASRETSVDPFAELISELSGGGESKVAEALDKPVPPTTESFEDPKVLGAQLQKDIAARADALAGKIKKYTEMTAELHLYPESTMKKVAAKRHLNEMKKDWNLEDLKTQDEARRQFVNQLFDGKPNIKTDKK